MTESKTISKGEVNYRFQTDWIYRLESETHWLLYRKQQEIIRKSIKDDHASFLEVGPGTGFCTNYLRSKGHRVTTLDIDDEKKPDIVSNLVDFKPTESYNALLAFQIFEHMPYQEFIAVIDKLKGHFNTFIISLPVTEFRVFHMRIILPIIKAKNLGLYLPHSTIHEPNHFWEINRKTNLKKIKKDFSSLGLRLEYKEKYHSKMYLVFSHT